MKYCVLLKAVTATGAGGALVLGCANKVFQVTGTFVGTVAFEGSLDGTNYVSLATATAPGKYGNQEPWYWVRANVTAYTSGSITVVVGEGPL